MTVSIKDIRINISPEQIDAYVPKRGIDSVFKPYDINENIYDVRFLASDKNPVTNERLTTDDINKELEQFKEVSGRMRDSPLYVKSFDKSKINMVFETNKDNKALESIDDVRSQARNMTLEKDVPQGKRQIRWQDK